MVNKKILFFVLVLLLLALIILLVRFHNVERIPIYITVDGYAGVNLNDGAVYLGTVFPGGRVARGVVVHAAEGAVVLGRVEGLSFLSVHPSYQVVDKTGQAGIEVLATVPAGQPYGNYTGELVIRVLPGALRNLFNE